MRVLVAAVSASSFPSGVQRHAFNLVRSLLTQHALIAIDLVLATWQEEMIAGSGLAQNDRLTIHFAAMPLGALARNRWYYLDLPKLAAAFESDVVHLTYPAPLRGGAFACPVVVTLHDLYPHQIPANFGLHKALFNLLILQQCLRAADAIACVSDSTYLLLQRYVPSAVRRRALRIYNSAEPAIETSAVSAAPWQEESPFLLCVAQHRRNKNLVFLLRVFAQLLHAGQIDPAMRLVIVGIEGPETEAIRRLILQEDLTRKVVLREGLSEQALQWCYSNCRLVVAPSTVEGFGLPIVEARMAGAPVVCSSIPAFREFGDAHCRYVALDKNALRGFADAIVTTLQATRWPPSRMPQLAPAVIGRQYFRLYTHLHSAGRCGENYLLSAAVLGVEPCQESGQERN